MICELYSIRDEEIQKLRALPEVEASGYLVNNYANAYLDINSDNVFSIDKGWDVARFLLCKNDPTAEKILNNIYGYSLYEDSYSGYYFLLSGEVSKINTVLQGIQHNDLFKYYDEEEMIAADVYKANCFAQNFIDEHIREIIAAFKKSGEAGYGLITNIG